MKRCEACGRVLPLTEEAFHKDPNAVDGYRSDCKVCRNQQLASASHTAIGNEMARRFEQADLEFLKIIESLPPATEMDNVPHMAALYERLNYYLGGADGWARHMMMVYLQSGPAIRARILFKLSELGVHVSKEGYARVPVDMLSTEDLERELEKRIQLISVKSTKPTEEAKPEEPKPEPKPEGEDHAES